MPFYALLTLTDLLDQSDDKLFSGRTRAYLFSCRAYCLLKPLFTPFISYKIVLCVMTTQ